MIERSEDRDQALRAALPHVPALGWSRAALRRISSCPTLRGGLGGLLPPPQLAEEAR
jgi:hypothetical protein